MKRTGRPATSAERKAAHDARKRAIAPRPCANKARRRRLERDPAAWLRYYMPGSFPLPWSDSHRAIIKAAINAAKTGTGAAVAAPRGEGKTTVLRGVCMYLVATRKARFPLMAGWTHRAAGDGFRMWMQMLHGSPRFRADYPDLTQPFEDSTHAARMRLLTWETTGEECGAQVRANDRVIVLPDSIGAIASASVQGDIKGLSVALPNGETIRPDLLLLDDSQDPKRADNPQFVADVVETIEKQWMCLAGPTTRITTMIACTVAAPGDVSEHFLNRDDFDAVRVSRVESWPDGWDERESAARKHWDAWHAALVDGMRDRDGGKAARDYYTANRDAMTAGMRVSWAERYDRKRKDPDALYSAMFDYYRIGDRAFASEYQNKPKAATLYQYDVTPALVMSRVSGFGRHTAPDGASFIVAAADVNFVGLNWTMLACRKDAAGWCVDWSKWPEDRDLIDRKRTSGLTDEQAIANAVVSLARHVDAIRVTAGDKIIGPDVLGIDVGYMTETVLRAIASLRLPLRVIGVRGRDEKKYRIPKDAIKHGEGWFVQDWQSGRVVVINVDHWREQMQRAFLLQPGVPGSIALYGSTPHEHERLAMEITANRLKERVVTGVSTYYNWAKDPTRADDLGDAMTYAYALANMSGATGGGPDARDGVARTRIIVGAGALQERRKPRRVPRVEME